MAALLFDIDGVLYQENAALPGASEALAWCAGRGIPHLFLTNTTSRPRRQIRERLAGLGMEVKLQDLLTPPVAAANWLRQNLGEAAVALFVPRDTREEFAEFPLHEDDPRRRVGAVVVGDLAQDWDFRTLNRAFRLLTRQQGTVLAALGMTRYWQGQDGLQLDTGPFVVALQYASGIAPRVFGKPEAGFFREALATLGQPAAESFIVGDDIRSDIGGGQEAGLRGILVRTGKFRPQDLELPIKPYAVLDSVADLPAWWQARVSS
ncbi:MAG: TIGR01458 family HAD-type hydrolase [Gammaproteobacteria bacterium]|nr:TIGR01458 family HAD-type hydrolase [Gammaproteobacteria bacterium]